MTAQYRDVLPIVTLRSVSSSIAPRVWRSLDTVVLTYGVHRVEVGLTRVIPEKGCIKTPRVWFVAPCCGGLVGVLAFCVDDDVLVGRSNDGPPIACRRCMRWRSRSYRVSGKAPHVGPVKATASRGQ